MATMPWRRSGTIAAPRTRRTPPSSSVPPEADDDPTHAGGPLNSTEFRLPTLHMGMVKPGHSAFGEVWRICKGAQTAKADPADRL